MAVELTFSKPDSGAHWGFRLVGGADFNEPLVVVKVNKNSYAEDAGLLVGDVIVRINETPTAGVTHLDAHELINKAGCKFIMAVRRGLFSDLPDSFDEESSEEVQNILSKVAGESKHTLGPNKDQTVGSPPINLENLAGQEQTVDNTKSKDVTIQRSTKSRKWSTFLVKPKNPKPQPRKLPEERQIIGEPYKVKIIKQPKRDPNQVLNHRKSVQFEPVVTEVEISRDPSIADSIDSLEISDKEMEEESSICIEEVEEANVEEERQSPVEEPPNEEQTVKKLKPILKPSPIDIHIDPVICESSLSLEQQLEAVQKQLLALSQLPTAIQVTLEAVTQQLNKIVMDKNCQVKVEENGDCNNDENPSEATLEENGEDIVSVTENAEGDLTDNDADEALEDLEDDHVVNGNGVEDDQVECEEEEQEPEIVDPYAGLTEEEKEAKIRQEQILAKKQKIEEERRKMDWTQRPIVLPGGRKWSNPEDTVPKFRAPKLSDEKICKTIEDHSEVIVGKTKGWIAGTKYGPGAIKRDRSIVPGSRIASWYHEKLQRKHINFLKFQPPPKNLDYLQKSEVYRLIHDMEPPVRGVGARAEKILSEKDYYGDKGAP